MLSSEWVYFGPGGTTEFSDKEKIQYFGYVILELLFPLS